MVPGLGVLEGRSQLPRLEVDLRRRLEHLQSFRCCLVKRRPRLWFFCWCSSWTVVAPEPRPLPPPEVELPPPRLPLLLPPLTMQLPPAPHTSAMKSSSSGLSRFIVSVAPVGADPSGVFSALAVTAWRRWQRLHTSSIASGRMSSSFRATSASRPIVN